MASEAGTASREIADGIHAVDAPFWGFPLALYFIRGGDCWAVVDTGIATTPADHVGPFLEEHGGVASLDLALLTHGHVDHIGGNGALKELAPQVRFALHERDLGWAENVDRHYQQLYAVAEPDAWRPDADFEAAIRGALSAPVAIDLILSDGDTVELGGGRVVEVHHVGGHAPGHVVFFEPETRTAFCGDALQGSGALNTETGKRDFPLYRTLRDYRAGLETVRALAPERLCTGHAGVLTGDDIGAAIDASMTWTEGYHALVRDLAAQRGTFTLAEMVDDVLRERPEHAQLMQVYATTAEHLDELVRTGDLRPEIAGGVKRWTVTGS